MKCSMPGGALAYALGIVSGAVPRRSTRTVLNNILMKCVAPSEVTLTATDMEVGVRERLVGKVSEEGEALIPASRFHAIVKELDADTIELSSTEKQLKIVAPGAVFKLVCSDPKDFPNVPEVPAEGRVTIDGKTFREAIERSTFAAAPGETRYAIHGVLLEVEAKILRMVATDGKRLALVERATEIKVKDMVSALLPSRALQLMGKGWGDDEWKIDLVFEDRRVLAQAGDTTVVASLIDGTFPTWSEVLPKPKYYVPLDREEFMSCVRRGSLVATEGSNSISLTLSPGKLKVAARASNVGEGEIEMPMAFEGDEVVIHFNPKYLLDYLKIETADEVKLGFTDPRSAVLFEAGKGFRYVAMPVTMDSGDQA